MSTSDAGVVIGVLNERRSALPFKALVPYRKLLRACAADPEVLSVLVPNVVDGDTAAQLLLVAQPLEQITLLLNALLKDLDSAYHDVPEDHLRAAFERIFSLIDADSASPLVDALVQGLTGSRWNESLRFTTENIVHHLTGRVICNDHYLPALNTHGVSDHDELLNAYQHPDTPIRSQHDVIQRLALNPSLPQLLVERLAGQVDAHHVRYFHELHPDIPVVALLKQHPELMMNRASDEEIVEVGRYLNDPELYLSVSYHFPATSGMRRTKEDLLTSLSQAAPNHLVPEFLTWNSDTLWLEERLGAHVVRIIGEFLGDDMDSWQAFEVLSDGFTGTIRELLDLTLAL